LARAGLGSTSKEKKEKMSVTMTDGIYDFLNLTDQLDKRTTDMKNNKGFFFVVSSYMLVEPVMTWVVPDWIEIPTDPFALFTFLLFSRCWFGLRNMCCKTKQNNNPK